MQKTLHGQMRRYNLIKIEVFCSPVKKTNTADDRHSLKYIFFYSLCTAKNMRRNFNLDYFYLIKITAFILSGNILLCRYFIVKFFLNYNLLTLSDRTRKCLAATDVAQCRRQLPGTVLKIECSEYWKNLRSSISSLQNALLKYLALRRYRVSSWILAQCCEPTRFLNKCFCECRYSLSY